MAPPEGSILRVSPAGPIRGGALNLKEKLETELKTLERELRIELPQEIKKALAMGDLRENAEYHAALERQSYVKARIGQLRLRLQELSLIRVEDIPRDRIGLGSQFKVMDLDGDKEIRYELVLPEEADPSTGKVSITSPLGKGFQGRAVGEEVAIQVPSGRRTYEILDLKTIHDRN
jgi:transcription elongation factor GreA